MLEEDIKVLKQKTNVSEANFSKTFPEIYKRIIEFTNQFSITSWNEKKYVYTKQLKELPVCRVCGKPVLFKSANKGYKATCSRECDILQKSNTQKNNWKNKNV